MTFKAVLKKQIIGSNNENELFFKRYFIETYCKVSKK